MIAALGALVIRQYRFAQGTRNASDWAPWDESGNVKLASPFGWLIGSLLPSGELFWIGIVLMQVTRNYQFRFLCGLAGLIFSAHWPCFCWAMLSV